MLTDAGGLSGTIYMTPHPDNPEPVAAWMAAFGKGLRREPQQPDAKCIDGEPVLDVTYRWHDIRRNMPPAGARVFIGAGHAGGVITVVDVGWHLGEGVFRGGDGKIKEWNKAHYDYFYDWWAFADSISVPA